MTPEFDAFVAPARRQPQLWRLALGLVLILGVYLTWMAAIGGLVWLASGLDGLEFRLVSIGEGGDPASVLLLLLTFLGMALGAWAAARFLHGRGLKTLFGPPGRVARDFVLGLGAMLVVGGGLGLLLLPFLPPLESGAPLGVWLALLPLALAGLLIQTGAEEMVFRGYLQQQLAARFVSPMVWMLLPAVLFGLAHHAPADMGDSAWFVVAATGLFGLIAADLTARTGSIGLAWGMHFANNVLAILIVSTLGGLGGLALFRLPAEIADPALLRPLILADMALMLAVWLACRLWLRRR